MSGKRIGAYNIHGLSPTSCRCLQFLIIATALPLAAAPLEGPTIIPLTLHSPVNAVVGRWAEDVYVASAGAVHEAGTQAAALEVFDAKGRLRWKDVYREEDCDYLAGAYIQWIAGAQPYLVYSVVPQDDTRLGAVRVLDARDGSLISHTPNGTRFGNNNSLVVDVTGDGQAELLYADLDSITCYDVPRMQPHWRLDTGVRFCWSLPALWQSAAEEPLVVFGSEYNNDDHSSSLLAINLRGEVLWRSDGHAEDLGSTPVFPVALRTDGETKFLKVGLDLEHRQGQDWNHLHVFSRRGALEKRIPLGFTGIALGDMDGDGALDGVGLSNTRDGGHHGLRVIRGVDLDSGQETWATPVPRAYLDTNSPVMGDFDGDGALEAVVGTGNPAGYARLPNSEPWGDLYVVKTDGNIAQHLELPGWPVNLAFCDLNDDGHNELIVVVDGKPGWLYAYRTKTPVRQRDWPTQFGNAARTGAIGVR